MKKILITSALPYANGPLHFGHIAGAYLPGDCFARFQRLMGNEVLYICGSDEYGVAITLSAEMAGREPKEHVEIYHKIIKDFFKTLNISFNHYSRTTWQGHNETVQQFFLELLENGYIEEKVTDQLYSEKDRRFLADRYVVGICPGCSFENARGDECPKCGASFEATDLKNPRSKLSGAPLTKKATTHWFLRLDLFKDNLSKWLQSKHWKPNVLNFVQQYIKDLRPRAITRDSEWGVPIPLPNTAGKVLYVWFDAPIGYISATKEWAASAGDPDRWQEWWLDPDTQLVQFIGKDNIPFHAAIFPAMIMGQNLPYKLVDELPANEFYLLEGKQFSKSDGWYVDLETFFKSYTADQIRYAIAANAPETADSAFAWKDFQQRCNSELVGKFGNLVNRTLVFARNHTSSKAPHRGSLEEIDREFLKTVASLAEEAKEAYSQFRLRRACQVMMELCQVGNTYFDAKKPWEAAKDETLRPRMETTIACCLECLKTLALISSPVIPDAAVKLWAMLGYEGNGYSWEETMSQPLPAGQELLKPEILFRKVEDEEIEKELEKLHALSQKQEELVCKKGAACMKELIDFDAFQKLDLRAGTIVAAEQVKKSKKLLKLQVDIGIDTRTIVSGIRTHFTEEELVGRRVVVVANLQPATIMGIESRGMLLAAESEGKMELLSPGDVPAGSMIG